jgi:hypothetical protein
MVILIIEKHFRDYLVKEKDKERNDDSSGYLGPKKF